MEKLLKEFEKLCTQCEPGFLESVEGEAGEEINFSDYAIEVLEDFRDGLENFLLAELPSLFQSEIRFENLPEIFRADNAIDFADALSQIGFTYKYMQAFLETVENEEIDWYPLYNALRRFLTVETIRNISSQNQLEYAIRAFDNINSEFFDYEQLTDLTTFLPQLQALIEHPRLSEEDRELIEAIIAFCDGSAFIYTPQPIEFDGSSGGLERPFVDWLETFLTSPLLFENEDLEDVALQDPTLEKLKMKWLSRPPIERLDADHLLWQTISVNAPVEFEDFGKQIEFKIDQVLREGDSTFVAEPSPNDTYRLVLYRTGERHEYDPAMDQSLLALQVLVLSQNFHCPVENIQGEIDWLRLDERDYPLTGLNERELDDLSQTYIQAQ